MDNRAIGVFDSGFGGLTVAEELSRLLPNEDIIYFGDSGRVPYGGRSAPELAVMCRQNIEYMKSFDVKLVLAGCGTVSSVVLPTLEPDRSLPVFGVLEPAARVAATSSVNARLGLIATQATISAGAFERSMLNVRPGLRITAAACPKFVPLIESGHFRSHDNQVSEAIREHLSVMKKEGVDTLLLGCTHYPLMADAISAFLGPGVKLVSASAAAAVEVARYLKDSVLAAGQNKTGRSRYFTSGSAENFRETASVILGKPLSGEVIEISPFPL